MAEHAEQAQAFRAEAGTERINEDEVLAQCRRLLQRDCRRAAMALYQSQLNVCAKDAKKALSAL